MDATSSRIPMLPSRCCSIVYHVEVTWETVLPKHVGHELNIACLRTPLRQDGDAYKSCEEMPVEAFVRFSLQSIVHFLLQVIWNGTHKEWETLVKLQAMGIGGILLIIICGMDEVVDVRLFLLVKLCLVCLAK